MFITKFTQKLEEYVQKNPLLYKIMLAYYKPLVKCEIRLAGIECTDKVLCVGGGSCPITAILFRKYTGADITVIDNNPYCVKNAKKFLNKKGIDGIDVVCCEGIKTCCNNYSVVHLAMQVSPMEETLKKLMKDAKTNARFLVRTPKRIFTKLYKAKVDCNKAINSTRHTLFANVGYTMLFRNIK
ncbi:MAG: class I SAM-dependent methyltransferase [Bacillota bacterium]|jgi:D-arabinose 1-dehydrogenase-like Zn-dependent alcohol dehydrogenase|nr:class I SAM-dependent methyltransferase [Bacillota bacterium]NLP22123.1 class I SAM-dependent methyltransferase [Erysipelotrichaceae bacterium]